MKEKSKNTLAEKIQKKKETQDKNQEALSKLTAINNALKDS